MELRFCYERGIPHSQFLAWPESDRHKLLAYLLEESERCSMCGTAKWEWAEDQFAYIATVSVCEGCKAREVARDSVKDVTGGSIVLVSGEQKKAALEKQKAAYLASRGERKGRRK